MSAVFDEHHLRSELNQQRLSVPPYLSKIVGAFACSGFSAKLHKSATEKHNPKKHLSLLVAICDRKHANRVPWPKVVV